MTLCILGTRRLVYFPTYFKGLALQIRWTQTTIPPNLLHKNLNESKSDYTACKTRSATCKNYILYVSIY